MTPGGARTFGAALAVGIAGLAVAVAADDPLALPHTIEKVWYRTDTEHGTFGRKHEGDLRITDEALEFSAPRAELRIPLAALRMISLGPMGADFDTEWVVLGTEREGTRTLVGLRDGRKMGFGARTPQIFDTLVRLARERGLAQFGAPEGFVPYTQLDRQIALAVPEGYRALQHGVATLERSNVRGTVLFSPAAPVEAGEAGRQEIVERIRLGESPAWVLAIREARRGMRCSGMNDKGRADLAAWIGEHEMLGLGLAAATPLEAVPIDRCTGVRGSWRGALDGGAPIVLDVRAVSDDEFVYVLALRTTSESAAEAREAFERGVLTLRLAVARARSKGAL